MNYCRICGTEIEDNFILCPNCEMRLHPVKTPSSKTRKMYKIKKYITVLSYFLFIVFLISFLTINFSCYNSNNNTCYNTSLLNLVLSWCFGMIAAVLIGEDQPKWKPHSSSSQ